mgnify:CR=1 FL=1
MKKKIMAIAAGVLACALIAAGCGRSGEVVSYDAQEEEVTTITFFGYKYEPENVKVIEEIISSFMKRNPDIRVSYESLKGNGYYDALAKRMASGKGDDVFMVNHDILLDLEAQGQVEDLSDLDTIEEYTDQMLSQMQDEGGIYGVPTIVSAFGLYCNLDLLKEHKQEVPRNLEEWKEVCEYFNLNPYMLRSGGTLLLACANGARIVEQLKNAGVQAAVIGQTTAGNDRLIRYDDEARFLEPPKMDEYYKVN